MTDNRAEMAAAILNAILETNRAADGTITVDGEAATEALILALATIFEADESIRTPGHMRKVGEAVSMELRAKLKLLRAAYEQTGRRNWDADLVRVQ